MDLPPVHIQIPAGYQRQRKQNKKGTFTKVSGSANTQRTSNYRIRKLQDGRLGGQRHINRVVQKPIASDPNDIPHEEDLDTSMGGEAVGDPADERSETQGQTWARTKKRNTWAVRTKLLIVCAYILHNSLGPSRAISPLPRDVPRRDSSS